MMSIILARSAIFTYMSKSGKDFGTPCRYLADCLFLHMSINIRLQEIKYYVHIMMQKVFLWPFILRLILL